MKKIKAITKRMIYLWASRFTLDANRRSKATSKGHKHVVGETFKSIQHSDLTPAQYRHLHAKMVNGRIVKIARKKK